MSTTIRREAFNSLSTEDQERYNQGWKARNDKKKFERSNHWAWRMGWRDADNDPALNSEEMLP